MLRGRGMSSPDQFIAASAAPSAAALVHQPMEAHDEKRLLKLQRELQAAKLLIVNDLGYVPLSPTGAELLFEVFSQRYERGSIIVTSNLPFEDWTFVLGSPTIAGCPHSRWDGISCDGHESAPRPCGTVS